MQWKLGRKVVVWVLVGSSVLLPAQPMLAAGLAASSATSGSGARQQPVIRDVALQAGGVMRGQVLDSQGQPCSDVSVQIAKSSDVNARPLVVRTDSAGRFEFSGLAGGIHAIQTSQGAALCRLWTSTTAPPAAVSEVLLIAGDGLVRGSCETACNEGCRPRCGGFPIMLGPLEWAVIGAGIAAAIAIPVALANRDNNDAS
jgi:hypothetical protein